MTLSKAESEETKKKNQIILELFDLQILFSKPDNVNILKNNLDYIFWMKKRYQLGNTKPPTVVKQREVFYCYLGKNIGSEQGNRRPVVILQNNVGNTRGKTTIIAPITTYENSKIYQDEHNVWYIEYTNAKGEFIKRKLDFYEVPIVLEKSSKFQIHGVINIIHLREISKCRLMQTPVAMITVDNYNDVITAINHNLSIL